MLDVGRREFITLLGSAAVGWPLASHAQEAGRTYRLGFLIPAPRETPAVAAFFDELRANGFIEGQNRRSRNSPKREDSCPMDRTSRTCGGVPVTSSIRSRGKTCRNPGRAADQIRSGHQSNCSESARARNSDDVARPRRRGDRIAVHWPK
jgi:hypothetical protein